MITDKTFSFLKKLKQHNNREWFAEHKALYEASHEELIAFADQLLKGLNQFDQIETPSGKKSLFRIYRDIRFSKDKTPYKTNRRISVFQKTKHPTKPTAVVLLLD